MSHDYSHASDNHRAIGVPQTSPVVALTSPITPAQKGQSFSTDAALWLFQNPSPLADSQNREALARRLGATPDLQRVGKQPGHVGLDISQVSIGSLDLSTSNLDSSVFGGASCREKICQYV